MASNGLYSLQHEQSATEDIASGAEMCVVSSVDVLDRGADEFTTKTSGDRKQPCGSLKNLAIQVPSLDLPSTVNSPRTSRRSRLTKDSASFDCVSTLAPVNDQTKRFHSVIESNAEKSKVEITSEALQSTYHWMELKDIAGKLLSKEVDLPTAMEVLVPKLKESIVLLKSNVLDEKMRGIKETELLVEEGWSSRGIGRDLSYNLCDVLRVEGGLDKLISYCDDSSIPREIQLGAAHLLSRTLTVVNRDHIAKANALQQIVNWALRVQKNPEFCRAATAVLECMFKHSKNTCTMLIKMGGLDAILYSCRSLDIPILRYCAKALANLSIYGGYVNQCEMIKYNAPEWLFPLAFTEDDSTRYYALLAIAALCASKETEVAVARSGTLDLVAPFLRTHDPLEFGNRDPEHIHGQAKEWLGRLLRFLPCRREEAQSLIAFHFAMEAGIRREQNKLKLFREIGAIAPLKRLASSPSKLASKFAAQALKIIGEDLPSKLSPRVPLWTNESVVCWIQQLGFSKEIVSAFKECQVDGDLLLLLTEENLLDDIGIKNGIIRKRFMRELNELRQTADYRSIDSSHLNDWLSQLAPEFRRYTYQMLKCRVTVKVLPKLREEHLLKDCGVLSGVHRLLILDAAKSQHNYNAAKQFSIKVFISFSVLKT